LVFKVIRETSDLLVRIQLWQDRKASKAELDLRVQTGMPECRGLKAMLEQTGQMAVMAFKERKGSPERL
jgi:hypothetical protein